MRGHHSDMPHPAQMWESSGLISRCLEPSLSRSSLSRPASASIAQHPPAILNDHTIVNELRRCCVRELSGWYNTPCHAQTIAQAEVFQMGRAGRLRGSGRCVTAAVADALHSSIRFEYTYLTHINYIVMVLSMRSCGR